MHVQAGTTANKILQHLSHPLSVRKVLSGPDTGRFPGGLASPIRAGRSSYHASCLLAELEQSGVRAENPGHVKSRGQNASKITLDLLPYWPGNQRNIFIVGGELIHIL